MQLRNPRVAELVDAPDLGSGILGCESSSLSFRTILERQPDLSMKLLNLLIPTAIILASGCTTTRYIQTPLPLPPELVIEKISGDQLQCLSDATYKSLVRIDRAKTSRIETLKSIIETTH